MAILEPESYEQKRPPRVVVMLTIAGPIIRGGAKILEDGKIVMKRKSKKEDDERKQILISVDAFVAFIQNLVERNHIKKMFQEQEKLRRSVGTQNRRSASLRNNAGEEIARVHRSTATMNLLYPILLEEGSHLTVKAIAIQLEVLGSAAPL